MQNVITDRQVGITDTVIGLGNTAQTAEGKRQQAVEGMGGP